MAKMAKMAKRRTNSGPAAEVKPLTQVEFPAKAELHGTAPGSWCGFVVEFSSSWHWPYRLNTCAAVVRRPAGS